VDHELVIGIETHVQLGTRTKLFCYCAIQFGAPPNTLTCPVCSGQPGSLPTLNWDALRLGLRAALVLGCEIPRETKFDRKHYFYPDLPKGYQISQFDLPLSKNGFVELESGKKIKIARAHLEEDAGKLIHEENGNRSFVDLNRAGTPLIEIVTLPDLRSSEEAYQYLTMLRTIMRYSGVSGCDLEKGELRSDINLSIRPKGSDKLGTKVEIKNLNSFKNAKAAIDYEYVRQVRAVEAGEKIVEETRLWDVEAGVTRPMRSKEQVHDYRYFPEPDLPPLHILESWIEEVSAQIPELPRAKKARIAREYGIGDYAAGVLSSDPAMADLFEETTKLFGRPVPVSNWITNDLARIMNEKKLEMSQVKATPEGLAGLLLLVDKGQITGTSAKEALEKMVETGIAKVEIKDMSKIDDPELLEKAAKLVIVANPKAATDFLAGKDAAIKSLIGAVMKETRGRADPKLAEEVLRRLLSK
jgi:aspartyl-tRNA(Asn)/glutamyl-tRNA(Gln) amidotransferase subunit B